MSKLSDLFDEVQAADQQAAKLRKEYGISGAPPNQNPYLKVLEGMDIFGTETDVFGNPVNRDEKFFITVGGEQIAQGGPETGEIVEEKLSKGFSLNPCDSELLMFSPACALFGGKSETNPTSGIANPSNPENIFEVASKWSGRIGVIVAGAVLIFLVIGLTYNRMR